MAEVIKIDDTNPHSNDAYECTAETTLLDLVRIHHGPLYRFILKNIGQSPDAEDLTQQAFMEAVRAYPSFQGISELSTWLYGIAMNLVRNYLSRAPNRKYQFCSEEELSSLPSRGLTPDEAAIQSEQMQHLKAALSDLPESMREVLFLVGIEGLSYEEAAELLTVPVGTVRSRVSRARLSLKKNLAAKGRSLDLEV